MRRRVGRGEGGGRRRVGWSRWGKKGMPWLRRGEKKGRIFRVRVWVKDKGEGGG